MASRPGILTDWPWKPLGSFKVDPYSLSFFSFSHTHTSIYYIKCLCRDIKYVCAEISDIDITLIFSKEIINLVHELSLFLHFF